MLGICVGMQILFERGVEHGVRDEPAATNGPARSNRCGPPSSRTWAGTPSTPPQTRALFAGLDPDARYYFVHSYAVRDWELKVTSEAIRSPKVTWATHGEPFVAAVENGPLWATQFHPEKSGEAGARLLTNWLDTL